MNSNSLSIDPDAEESYWRENYSSRPYITNGATFNEYRPAFRYGVHAYGRYEDHSFEHAEPELMRDWDLVKGMSSLSWEGARPAVSDAWQRVNERIAQVQCPN